MMREELQLLRGELSGINKSKRYVVAPEVRPCHGYQEHWAQLVDWPAHVSKALTSYAPSFLELVMSSKP